MSGTQIKLETTLGAIRLELFDEQAPATVANFIQYVTDGFYTDTVFHRVIDGFMIQGGGLDKDLRQKPVRKPIANEAANGLRNTTGTIAMARTSDPHSATAQFFINVKDNASLDHREQTTQGWGYCVFGRVIDGMDTVNAIKGTPTGRRGGMQDVPVDAIKITAATLE